MPASRRRLIAVCVTVALAAAGAALVLYVTRWGAGTEPDSVMYIAAARNLRAGRGLIAPSWQVQPATIPLTHFPPLYPAVLAGIGALGGPPPLPAARFLNAALLALTIVLVGLILWRCTRRWWLAAMGCWAVLNAPRLIDVHVMAASEPLFFVLAMAAIAAAGMYLDRPRWGWLIVSAALAALSLLARYVGVVVVGAGALAVLLAGRGRSARRRIGTAAIFALAACGPMAAWAIRNKLEAGNATHRQLAFHPLTAEKACEGLLTVSRWFLPDSLNDAMKIAGALAAAAFVLVVTLLPHRRRALAETDLATPPPGSPDPSDDEPPSRGKSPIRDGPPAQGIPRALLLFGLLYPILLVVSICLFDAHTPLDNRLLSPLHLAGIVLVLAAADKLLGYVRCCRISQAVIVAVLLGFLAMATQRNVSWQRVRSDAEGFSARKWTRSAVMGELARTPASRIVYSNWPEAIYLDARRGACNIPFLTNPYTLQPNAAYGTDVADMRQAMNRGALLAYFGEQGRRYMPALADLRQHLGRLQVVKTDSLGTIYRLAQTSQHAVKERAR